MITIVCTALLGFLIEKIAYKPLRQAPKISLLITAVGVSLFLEYFLSLNSLFGPNYIAFPRPFEVEAYELGLITITNIQLIIFSVTGVTLLLLYLLIYKTKHGRAMRAVSHSQEVASLMGINVDATISFTFIIGAALAGVGGILYGFAYPQINVFMGIMPGIKSFIAAVLGGIGLVHGAVLGALIIGLSEVFVSAFLSSTLRDGFIFIILLVVLLLKPSGIFGKRIDKV
jgi:branched-chain amino acid transport system permease protein